MIAGRKSSLKRLAGSLAETAGELSAAIDRALEARSPRSWEIGGGRRLDLTRPLIMGVLNLSPDSFYSGSRVADTAPAVRRAVEMASAGADIIDFGGESTRPGAAPVDGEEEVRRVVPVVEAVAGELGESFPVSVDSYKAETAAAALDAGASIVNDIGAGLLDGGMLETVARAGAGYVMMHMRGKPRTMQQDTGYDDLLGEVHCFFSRGLDRCEAAGIGLEQVVLDPGIGFGKPPAGNYELILRLGEFLSLGRPLLIGASRKSFLKLAGQDEAEARLEGSLAACTVAVLAGAGIIRVHDVGPARRAVDAASVFAGLSRA
ncbi:MAG: dihydropteroate synthase [Candidatus Glassbacteria bacterium]|nr:dihydropteroate synthase [Candidatus Glassbacteria bacterium]